MRSGSAQARASGVEGLCQRQCGHRNRRYYRGGADDFFDVSLHIEHMRGVFHRRWALPDSADPEAIAASGFNGALALIPKQSESRLRRSQVGSVLQS